MLSLEKAFPGGDTAVLPALEHPPAAPGAELSCGGAGREALLWAQWLGRRAGAAPGVCHGVSVIPGPPPG